MPESHDETDLKSEKSPNVGLTCREKVGINGLRFGFADDDEKKLKFAAKMRGEL